MSSQVVPQPPSFIDSQYEIIPCRPPQTIRRKRKKKSFTTSSRASFHSGAEPTDKIRIPDMKACKKMKRNVVEPAADNSCAHKEAMTVLNRIEAVQRKFTTALGNSHEIFEWAYFSSEHKKMAEVMSKLTKMWKSEGQDLNSSQKVPRKSAKDKQTIYEKQLTLNIRMRKLNELKQNHKQIEKLLSQTEHSQNTKNLREKDSDGKSQETGLSSMDFIPSSQSHVQQKGIAKSKNFAQHRNPLSENQTGNKTPTESQPVSRHTPKSCTGGVDASSQNIRDMLFQRSDADILHYVKALRQSFIEGSRTLSLESNPKGNVVSGQSTSWSHSLSRTSTTKTSSRLEYTHSAIANPVATTNNTLRPPLVWQSATPKKRSRNKSNTLEGSDFVPDSQLPVAPVAQETPAICKATPMAQQLPNEPATHSDNAPCSFSGNCGSPNSLGLPSPDSPIFNIPISRVSLVSPEQDSISVMAAAHAAQECETAVNGVQRTTIMKENHTGCESGLDVGDREDIDNGCHGEDDYCYNDDDDEDNTHCDETIVEPFHKELHNQYKNDGNSKVLGDYSLNSGSDVILQTAEPGYIETSNRLVGDITGKSVQFKVPFSQTFSIGVDDGFTQRVPKPDMPAKKSSLKATPVAGKSSQETHTSSTKRTHVDHIGGLPFSQTFSMNVDGGFTQENAFIGPFGISKKATKATVQTDMTESSAPVVQNTSSAASKESVYPFHPASITASFPGQTQQMRVTKSTTMPEMIAAASTDIGQKSSCNNTATITSTVHTVSTDYNDYENSQHTPVEEVPTVAPSHGADLGSSHSSIPPSTLGLKRHPPFSTLLSSGKVLAGPRVVSVYNKAGQKKFADISESGVVHSEGGQYLSTLLKWYEFESGVCRPSYATAYNKVYYRGVLLRDLLQEEPVSQPKETSASHVNQPTVELAGTKATTQADNFSEKGHPASVATTSHDVPTRDSENRSVWSLIEGLKCVELIRNRELIKRKTCNGEVESPQDLWGDNETGTVTFDESLFDMVDVW